MANTSAAEINKLNRGYLHPFWNGSNGRFLYGVGELPRTLTELAMCQLSASIRKTDAWWTKFRDPDWRDTQWLTAATASLSLIHTSSGNSAVALSRKQIQYVLDELEGYAALRDTASGCEVSCFDRIWETTSPVDSSLLGSLQGGLNLVRSPRLHSLESTVHDVVDPQRHALAYGRSLVRHTDDTLNPIQPPAFSEENYTISPHYACIPTLLRVSPSSAPIQVSALSYINGIPPTARSLYRNIEQLLATSIPLFEHVLTDLHRSNLLCHRIPGTCRYTTWDEPLTPQHSDDEEGWANYEKEMRQWALNRPLEYPDVPEDGYPGGLEERKYRADLRGRNLKVIVKVTDIHIAPNSTDLHYGSTPWHAEGMRNERVVASAIHCIASTNSSPLDIHFRMPVRSPVGCSSDDEGATIRTWGLKLGAASHQVLGSASLRDGHAIAFPNIYQHRFGEVRLLDANAPGSMTLVTFLLVDPELTGESDDESDLEVPSTARVPPQQEVWIRQALEESLDVRVPTEIIDRIMAHTEGFMSEDEAESCTQEMRLERVEFWKQHNDLWFSLPFNGLDN